MTDAPTHEEPWEYWHQRAQTAERRIVELEDLLRTLDRLGGLGLEKHEWIKKALSAGKGNGDG